MCSGRAATLHSVVGRQSLSRKNVVETYGGPSSATHVPSGRVVPEHSTVTVVGDVNKEVVTREGTRASDADKPAAVRHVLRARVSPSLAVTASRPPRAESESSAVGRSSGPSVGKAASGPAHDFVTNHVRGIVCRWQCRVTRICVYLSCSFIVFFSCSVTPSSRLSTDSLRLQGCRWDSAGHLS